MTVVLSVITLSGQGVHSLSSFKSFMFRLFGITPSEVVSFDSQVSI